MDSQFKEPKNKEEIRKALKDYVWVSCGYMYPPGDPSRTNGYLLLALDPETAAKVLDSSGAWSGEIQKILGRNLSVFIFCLIKAIELALDGEPLRRKTFDEMFQGLVQLFNYLNKKEREYRQSLKVQRGEQELPFFLVSDEPSPEK